MKRYFILTIILILISNIMLLGQKQNIAIYGFKSNGIENKKLIERIESAVKNLISQYCNDQYSVKYRDEWGNINYLFDIQKTELEIRNILVKIAFEKNSSINKKELLDLKRKSTIDIVIVGKLVRNKQFEDTPNAYELDISLVQLSDLSLICPFTISFSDTEIEELNSINLKILRYLKDCRICPNIVDVELQKLLYRTKNQINLSISQYKSMIDTIISIESLYPNQNDEDLNQLISLIKTDKILYTLYLNQKIQIYHIKAKAFDTIQNPDLITARIAYNIVQKLYFTTDELYNLLKSNNENRETLKSLNENKKKYEQYINKLLELFPKPELIPPIKYPKG
jgi:hypothetical protein